MTVSPEKLSMEELRDLFGESIPMEAVRLIWPEFFEGVPHYDPLPLLRGKLKAIASAQLSGMTEETSSWQPIETAPKDGREVLLMVKSRAGTPHCQLVGHWMVGGHCIEDHPPIEQGWYFWTGSAFDKASAPTYWRALPDPPPRPPLGAHP